MRCEERNLAATDGSGETLHHCQISMSGRRHVVLNQNEKTCSFTKRHSFRKIVPVDGRRGVRQGGKLQIQRATPSKTKQKTTLLVHARGPYHRVDELGFQSSHANLVDELSDEGGVLSFLRVAHHPEHQRGPDQYRDVISRDAML